MKAVKMLKELVIDRKRWDRTTDKQLSGERLLNPDNNKMCCLGFLSRACGVPKKLILDITMPENVTFESDNAGEPIYPKNFNKKTFEKFVVDHVSHQLSEVNDSSDFTPKEKETKIKKLFRKAGITVKFKN
jgi:hypothetical protein